MANNSPDGIIDKYYLADFRMWNIMSLNPSFSPRNKNITGLFEVLATR